MSARIGTLPEGSKGFDANTRVSPHVASAFWDAGYRFVVRYVRRAAHHDYDLSSAEVLGLLSSGLGLMVVQHVAPEGWIPSLSLGENYGTIAAEEARAAGIPRGVMIWCDLEGVSQQASAQGVIEFCNAWFDAVKLAGFDPGLYVGYGAGLTADQLYYKLKFRRYWAAYNLNSDSYPSVRGVAMQQGPYPKSSQQGEPEGTRLARWKTAMNYPARLDTARKDLKMCERVAGVAFEYDTDIIVRDAFNNLPLLLIPGDPG